MAAQMSCDSSSFVKITADEAVIAFHPEVDTDEVAIAVLEIAAQMSNDSSSVVKSLQAKQ